VQAIVGHSSMQMTERYAGSGVYHLDLLFAEPPLREEDEDAGSGERPEIHEVPARFVHIPRSIGWARDR